MNDSEWLADRFEEQRPRLRSVAYRMLGSITEADDALQDAWLRVNRAGADDVDNLGGWLTTIVARVCLNMLRARNRRREEFFEEHLPDPIVSAYGAAQPEEQALLADSVGLALLVVLDTLTPAERLAFVLHDMFELPFDEIAPMVDRTPEATRQLASRARRRVRAPTFPLRTPTWRVSARSSTPSSRPRAAATSMVSSPSSIRTSFYARTSASSARSGCSGARRWSPAGHGSVSVPGAECGPPSLMELRVRSLPSAGGRSPSSGSPSATAGSRRSTRSSGPSASGGSPRRYSDEVLGQAVIRPKATTKVGAPPDIVITFIANPANAPRWMSFARILRPQYAWADRPRLALPGGPERHDLRDRRLR